MNITYRQNGDYLIPVSYTHLNNNLEDFLISEGAETTMGGLCDFLLYILFNLSLIHI